MRLENDGLGSFSFGASDFSPSQCLFPPVTGDERQRHTT